MRIFIKAYIFIAIFIIATQQIFCQVNAWSSKFDNISYGEVVSVAENSSNNLYLALGSDYINVSYHYYIYHYNKITEQFTNITGTAITLQKINDIELVNDSLLFVAGDIALNSTGYKFAKLNVLTKVWTGLANLTGQNAKICTLEKMANKLYLGGQFTAINSLNASTLCSYDYLSGTFDSIPGKLHMQNSSPPTINILRNVNNKLFIGGNYFSAGSNTLNSVGFWDGTNWFGMNGGLFLNYQTVDNPANIVCAIKDTLNSNDIYVGGRFTKANNIIQYNTNNNMFDCVMKWNYTLNIWDTIPFFNSFNNYSYTNGPYNLSSIQIYKNKLYCGYYSGTFANYNGGKYFITKMNASGWQLLPIAFNSKNNVSESKSNLFVYQNELLISKSNTMPINGMIRYLGTGANYKSFGNGISQDWTNQYSYGKIAEDNNHVYVASNTSYDRSVGNIKDYGVTRFNKYTLQWDSLKAWTKFPVTNIRIKGDTVCVVGQCNNSVYKMAACWSKTTKIWSPLFQPSTNFSSNCAVINDIVFYGNGFFIGGVFSINSNPALSNLAYFNGSTWDTVLAPPYTGEIKTLEITNDTLWVGGKFCINTPTMSVSFAAYKISTKQWIHLGQFTYGSYLDCNTNLALVEKIKIYKNKIFVNGTFTYYKNINGVLQSVNSGAGYFDRGTLAFTEFNDFTPQISILNNFITSFVESDSIIYLGGPHTYKNAACIVPNSQCDSAWSIVRYNYLTNKFYRLSEYGVTSTKSINYFKDINGITSFNNNLFITGAFNRAGLNYNSRGVAYYTIPYPVSNPVSVQSVSSINEISIYPNPSNNVFFVKSSKSLSTIQIFNLSGQLVSFTKEKYFINLFDKPPGIYIVKIIFTDNSQTISKIIKMD